MCDYLLSIAFCIIYTAFLTLKAWKLSFLLSICASFTLYEFFLIFSSIIGFYWLGHY
uniref:Uncharacterized protein n=1 Tax=Rhizophora mucronata TaxID=61149 RepID=A0A2P2N414_RHIMU